MGKDLLSEWVHSRFCDRLSWVLWGEDRLSPDLGQRDDVLVAAVKIGERNEHRMF